MAETYSYESLLGSMTLTVTLLREYPPRCQCLKDFFHTIEHALTLNGLYTDIISMLQDASLIYSDIYNLTELEFLTKVVHVRQYRYTRNVNTSSILYQAGNL